MSNSYQLGRKGEAEATRFLIQNNYSILEKKLPLSKGRSGFCHGYYFIHKYQKSSHYLMQKLQPLLNGIYFIKS